MTELQTPFKEIQPASSFDVYLQILGRREMPKSVLDMPQNLELTREIIGGLWESIQGTSEDGLERAQSIFWNGSKGVYSYSHIFKGNEHDTGDFHRYYLAGTSFFGRKPILLWHTHPEGVWYFSRQDISAFRAFQRQGYILAVGSEDGIALVAQTKQSAASSISSASVYNKARKFLTERKLIQKDAYEMSKIVDELGLKYYFYFPKGGITKSTPKPLFLKFWSYSND